MIRNVLLKWFADAVNIESLDLGGCEMLTNASLALIAEWLPRLAEVNLTYCEKITPDGILSFLASYPEMQVRALIALRTRKPSCTCTTLFRFFSHNCDVHLLITLRPHRTRFSFRS